MDLYLTQTNGAPMARIKVAAEAAEPVTETEPAGKSLTELMNQFDTEWASYQEYQTRADNLKQAALATRKFLDHQLSTRDALLGIGGGINHRPQGVRGPRGPRTHGVSSSILALLKERGDWMSAGDIVTALGDSVPAKNVPSTLQNLTNSEKIEKKGQGRGNVRFKFAKE